MYPSRTYHPFILDTPSVGAEHIIRNIRAFHPKHPDFSSKHPSFSSKPPGFSKQMPAIPLAEVED
jgi:hypothetical protein